MTRSLRDMPAEEGTTYGNGNSFGSDKRACKLTEMAMLDLAPKG